MTVLEIMERANTRDTKLTIAWIKDAIHAIESTQLENLKVKKQNIIKGSDGDDNQYSLPADLISLISVSVLDTESDQYKHIRRIADDPLVTEDVSP